MEIGSVDTVCYHKGCDDGLTSAMCVYYWFKKNCIEGSMPGFIGCAYGQKTLPDLTNKKVLMCDFSFPKEIMEKMIQETQGNFLCLDHHASAKTALVDIPDKYKVFNMGKSGASLTWDFCFPLEQYPLFIQYIEASDLWKTDSSLNWKAFSTAFREEVDALELPEEEKVAKFYEIFERLEAGGETAYTEMVKRGIGMLEFKNALVSKIARKAIFGIVDISGFNLETGADFAIFALVNSPILQSEIGDYFNQKYKSFLDFGATFSIDTYGERTAFSLRSNGFPTNRLLEVLKIGGGHVKASGAVVPGIVSSLPLPNLDKFAISRLMKGEKVLVDRKLVHFLREKFSAELVDSGRDVFLSTEWVSAIETGSLTGLVRRASDSWKSVQIGDILRINTEDKKHCSDKIIKEIETIDFKNVSEIPVESLFPISTQNGIIECLTTYWKKEDLEKDGLVIFRW